MNTSQIKNLSGVLLLAIASVSALAQAPIISSLGRNGELVCSNLRPGTTASVEWASSPTGPWTNTWVGLDAVTVDSSGAIRVNVPMFYRVRGVPSAPPGMILIPAGSFVMGNTFPDEGWSNELPLHTNQISAFCMDQHEVTKALWDTVYQWAVTNGYTFDNAGRGKAADHPVQTINWYDAVKWCNARSEREGRVPAYYTSAEQTTVYRTGQVGVQNDSVKWAAGYRLPTEAEWEKAARGGASGRRFPWSDTDTITHSRANYQSSASDDYDVSLTHSYHPVFQADGFPYTSPVGYFAANDYGLCEMAGNVLEWCWDRYGAYLPSPSRDPRGPVVGHARVFRGGGWYNVAFFCRSASRDGSLPVVAGFDLGFRGVLPQDEP